MSEIEEEKQSAGAESSKEDAAAPEEKADIKIQEEQDLERLIISLKREFRVPEEKLRVVTDEEVMVLIRDRWKKLGTEKPYAYLAGPIETFGDFGASWREWIAPKLWERGIVPLDPVKFESYKTGLSLVESLKKLADLRKQRDWQEFRGLAGRVRQVDTNLIRHKSSFIIMHIPSRLPGIDKERLAAILNRRLPEIIADLDAEEQELAIRLVTEVFPEKILPEIFKAMARGEATGGTSSETQIAAIEKIPILLVCFKEALDTFTSSWVLDVILERGKIFLRFNSLLKFLDQNLDKIRDESKKN